VLTIPHLPYSLMFLVIIYTSSHPAPHFPLRVFTFLVFRYVDILTSGIVAYRILHMYTKLLVHLEITPHRRF
jgi:hypothetical protein